MIMPIVVRIAPLLVIPFLPFKMNKPDIARMMSATA
jgi:hypothetical protein